MGRKKKVVKYKEYFQKHTAEELFRKYREQTSRGSLADLAAREQVTSILNTVRMYEAYVKRIEAQYKRELRRTQRELKKATQRIKELERQANQARPGWYKINPLAVVKQPQAGTSVPSTSGGIKIQHLKKIAEIITKKHEQREFEKFAESRGASIGETVGRKSHESKDTYGDITARLETYGQIYLTQNQKDALARSAKFREHIHKSFEGKLSPEELSELFEKNFGSGARIIKPIDAQERKLISWSYTPKKKKT